jgi:hypothetical protein
MTIQVGRTSTLKNQRVRLSKRWISFLTRVQKTCSVPSRLGDPRNSLDGHNGGVSISRITRQTTYLDTLSHNAQGDTTHNRTKCLSCSNRRYTHQRYSKLTYLSIITIIVISRVHPTRPYNTIRILE